jgi:hypothetical protein
MTGGHDRSIGGRALVKTFEVGAFGEYPVFGVEDPQGATR